MYTTNYVKLIAYTVILFFFILMIFNLFTPYDATDNMSNKNRSGLVLYTDHETGCQYVKAGLFSGITPRLDKSGSQICYEDELK